MTPPRRLLNAAPLIAQLIVQKQLLGMLTIPRLPDGLQHAGPQRHFQALPE